MIRFKILDSTVHMRVSDASTINGKDGVTPHIGDNGNWYLGDVDTGNPSRGETGPKGEPGYTPQRGTDYWTAADQNAIVSQAVTKIQPDISGIKDDLATKLPKSPANWGPWTAEEQATARERIGISEEFERVFLLDEIWEDDTQLTVDVNNLSHFRIFILLSGGVTSSVADSGLISCTDSNGNKIDSFFELGTIAESISTYDTVAYCQYDINDVPTMTRWGQAGGNLEFRIRGGLIRAYSAGKLIPNYPISKIHFPTIKGRVRIAIWGY